MGYRSLYTFVILIAVCLMNVACQATPSRSTRQEPAALSNDDGSKYHYNLKLLDHSSQPIADTELECVFAEENKDGTHIVKGVTDAEGEVTLGLSRRASMGPGGVCLYEYEGERIVQEIRFVDVVERKTETVDYEQLGNLLDDRFYVYEDQVLDAKTGLEWQRCSVGQRFFQGRCTGDPARYAWVNAVEIEVEGWRLPTLEELNSIVDCGGFPEIESRVASRCSYESPAPTVNVEAFPDTPLSLYWTATETSHPCCAYWISFENGLKESDGGRYIGMYVRLVRDYSVQALGERSSSE